MHVHNINKCVMESIRNIVYKTQIARQTKMVVLCGVSSSTLTFDRDILKKNASFSWPQICHVTPWCLCFFTKSLSFAEVSKNCYNFRTRHFKEKLIYSMVVGLTPNTMGSLVLPVIVRTARNCPDRNTHTHTERLP